MSDEQVERLQKLCDEWASKLEGMPPEERMTVLTSVTARTVSGVAAELRRSADDLLGTLHDHVLDKFLQAARAARNRGNG